jgi:hypothetical protein
MMHWGKINTRPAFVPAFIIHTPYTQYMSFHYTRDDLVTIGCINEIPIPTYFLWKEEPR